jgi:hypothetical protein
MVATRFSVYITRHLGIPADAPRQWFTSEALRHSQKVASSLPGTRFTNFTKFLIRNPANFFLAPLSEILPIAC